MTEMLMTVLWGNVNDLGADGIRIILVEKEKKGSVFRPFLLTYTRK